MADNCSILFIEVSECSIFRLNYIGTVLQFISLGNEIMTREFKRKNTDMTINYTGHIERQGGAHPRRPRRSMPPQHVPKLQRGKPTKLFRSLQSGNLEVRRLGDKAMGVGGENWVL